REGVGAARGRGRSAQGVGAARRAWRAGRSAARWSRGISRSAARRYGVRRARWGFSCGVARRLRWRRAATHHALFTAVPRKQGSTLLARGLRGLLLHEAVAVEGVAVLLRF